MSHSGGIDTESTTDDVREALRSQGVELRIERDGDGWVAVALVQDAPQLRCTGPTEDDAARTLWAAYLRRNDTTGAS